MQNASNWAQTCKTVYMSLGLHVKTVASIKPFFCLLSCLHVFYIYIYIYLSVTIPKAITYDVTYKNTDKLFKRFHILTRVAWYWSSPHTLWALWCYNAHGICSHMFGNGNHSEGTSGKYRRTLVSDMFCEPETDRDKYSFVSLTVTLSWELRILLSAFGYSQNYASSRGRDLKPPPAALPQLVKWNRYSNPSVIFYWGREKKKKGMRYLKKQLHLALILITRALKIDSSPELTSPVLNSAWRQRSTEAAGPAPSVL